MNDPAPKHVTIYTDGACAGNPGPGGWAALLLSGGAERELSGGEAFTTNNRMEMLAAIEGLKALKKPCEVDLFTDSQYVHKGITGWVHGWRRKGWRTASGEPVKNVELWQELERVAAPHRVTWHWVRGHADDALNNRVDQMAVAAMAPFKKGARGTPAPAAAPPAAPGGPNGGAPQSYKAAQRHAGKAGARAAAPPVAPHKGK